jgi:hypothetical protein
LLSDIWGTAGSAQGVTKAGLLHGLLRAFFLGLLIVGLCSCDRADDLVKGRWVSEQTSLVSIYFYTDGTAALTGTDVLRLKWNLLEDKRTVRIEILDRKIIVHFVVREDTVGLRGTLEWAGFDAMVFRKKSS